MSLSENSELHKPQETATENPNQPQGNSTRITFIDDLLAQASTSGALAAEISVDTQATFLQGTLTQKLRHRKSRLF